MTDARTAMLTGAIHVAYQPIVDLRDGQPKKVEALARWTHPHRGVIGPDVFIPWAERTGLIDELGEWILARACHDVVTMQAAGIEVDLSVNVSVVQLRHADVSERIRNTLASAGLAPSRLWIEVTEGVLLDAEAITSLTKVHAFGVRLMIDDFGTGFANFDYLNRLVVDALKIDTTFVAGLGTESRATAIVRAILSVGRELGLEVVAEGIENESHRAQLVELNCRLGQGWLFSRALSLEDLMAAYAPGAVRLRPNLVERSPANAESVRLSALRACRILDTDPEPGFDSIVRLASQLLSAPLALIALTDADRQWFKARVGTDLTEIQRAATFSSIANADPDEQLLIGDTNRDARFAANPFVIGVTRTRSYADAPIRSREGLLLGTLSVADTSPRVFNPRELDQLALLADQVSELLDLRRRTVELDDLYIGARHGGQAATAIDNDVRARVVAPANDALAQLTRVAGRRVAAPRDGANVLRFDGLLLDLDDRMASVDGVPLETPGKEFDLLAFLAARPGQVFSRTELLHHVWNSKPEWQGPSSVTEHVQRLRSKIDTDPDRPRLLRTVHGKGYTFQPANPPATATEVTDAQWGTWIHVDFRVVDADDGMVSLLAGRTPADLIGREVTDFVANSSLPAVRAGREMRAAGMVLGPQVITLRALDGTERLALVSTDLGEFDGAPCIVGIAREIVNAPRLMRQLVSGFVAEVSDAVIVTDPDLRMLSWNPAAERLYGWSEQEVLGHTFETVVRADTVFRGGPPWEELQLNGSWTGSLRQHARDGSTMTVASSVNLLREHGEITGIVVVNRLAPPRRKSVKEFGTSTSSQRAVAERVSCHDTEQARLGAVGACHAVDMPPDAAFDSLTRLAARLMETPIAAVSLVGRDHQWFMSTVGVDLTSTRRDVAFSSVAIATPDEVFIVNDTALDERFADNPFVTSAPFVRAYAAMPVCSREGLPFGTLSVVDTKPRQFTDQQIRFLKLLALQAAALLDLRRRTGELDDLIGEQSKDFPSDSKPGGTLGESLVQGSSGAIATITSVRRRASVTTIDETAIDPEASMLRLAAARSLLRAEAVEEAVGVVIGLVRDLGGSTIPARLDDGGALPMDCSLGHGEPLLARAYSSLARLRIERILPEVLDDAREAISRLRQRDDFVELSNTDSLTGLLNRRAVDRLLTRLRPDDALVVIDIDNFKDVNDRWGHAAGDELLIAFARALRCRCRPGDQFGRLGGDELVAILFGAGRVGLASFLNRLHETWLIDRPREVTYSAGAALVAFRSGPQTLRAADASLYSAKAMGRDRVAVETTPEPNRG